VPRPVALIILDGFGVRADTEANAIALADTPVLDRLNAECPHGTLHASGEWVGLPDGQMGNSEVGHLNLGAGRVVYQDITKISKAIRDGDFFENRVLVEACKRVGGAAAAASGQEPPAALHLMGLLSDGGVHSHQEHIEALIELANREGVERLFIHAFLDGRDVPPQSALGYIEELEAFCAAEGLGRIATISGRYYAMDRDKRWERVKLAYDVLVHGQGDVAPSAAEAVKRAYDRGENDEFVQPVAIEPVAESRVRAGDSVIFFNFRPDRARELTRAFIDEDFDGFDRGAGAPDVHFVTMTDYDATFDIPAAYPKVEPKNGLGDVLAAHGLTQLHMAETEKYAHVTFFFNGGIEEPKAGEERILIPSPKVATYDLMPEMSACKVADAAVARLDKGGIDVLIMNFANPDMVGHTGILPAAMKAIEAVDECMGRVIDKVRAMGGEVLLTADHGNAEQMIDNSSCQPHTAHTTDDVPFFYIGDRDVRVREGGALCDVAPTVLELLGIDPPPEMTGTSLLEKM
jgi:2,3-bisphosphoglycerate-independent phosphoglycerate mutase